MLQDVVFALGGVFDAYRLLMLAGGVMLGLVVGVIPGLGGIFGLSMLVPLTYGLDTYSAVALLLGLAAATTISDTIPSVLIGVPGTVGAAPTALDGHALARRGEAARALGAAYFGSLIGGLFGAFVLLMAVPLFSSLTYYLKIPDFLAAGVMGLVCVALVSGRRRVEGLAAALIGLSLSFVGLDPFNGAERWTLGQIYLWDGIPLPLVFLGLFSLPELAALLRRGRIVMPGAGLSQRGMLQGVRDVLREWRLVFQSSGLAALLGAVPGLGLAAISWVAYGLAARRTKGGEAFGQGNIRGVIAPESAANATEGGTLIPTLVLGLPGSASMSLILAGLMIQGIIPGPGMLQDHADLTFAMVFILALANGVGTVVCLLLTNWFARLSVVPASLIVPVALVCVCNGAFQVHGHAGDAVVLIVFGVLGILMRRQGWSRPAFALGFVLGPTLEKNFMLATQLSGADWLFRPSVLAMGAVILAAVWLSRKKRAAYGAGGQTADGGHTVERDSPHAVYESVLVAASAVLAVVLLLGARALPTDAAIFPFAAAVPLFAVSAVLAVRLARHRGAWLAAGSGPLRCAGEFTVLAVAVGFFAGLYLVGPTASAFVVTLSMACSGARGWAAWGKGILFAAAFAGAVWLVFRFAANVPWPAPLIGADILGGLIRP